MTSLEFRNNPMFLRNQFEGEGVFGIPELRKDDISLEKIEFIGYDKLNEKETDKIVHFFLDDYKFEVLWKDPEPRIERLRRYRAVLAPNYSLYTEMPLALKVYNTFRSRWCAAYFQSKNIKVIPTVAWGEPDTFWFCFDGIPKGSIVAVSTLGVRTEKSLFMQGYNEMLRKIKPHAVICYGKPFDEMKGHIIEVDYEETNGYKKYFTMNTKPDRCFGIYTKQMNGVIEIVKGMGSASKPKTDVAEQQIRLAIPRKKIEDMATNVRKAYLNYKKYGWKGNYNGQTAGTKAGRKWLNKKQQLPSRDVSGKPISYNEFDVNGKQNGALRDKERFVRGSDDSVYYTSDHYNTFTQIID